MINVNPDNTAKIMIGNAHTYQKIAIIPRRQKREEEEEKVEIEEEEQDTE